jgi:hypothetical protein
MTINIANNLNNSAGQYIVTGKSHTSLGNLLGTLNHAGVTAQAQNQILGNLVFNDHNNHEYARSYEVIEVKEDLLALSVAWHRIRSKGELSSIHTLIFKELFEKVNSQDRELANVIRDYYSKKLMVLKLKNSTLSKFREDLNIFIHNKTNIHKKEIFPLVYRLPEFYQYDSAFDKIKMEHDSAIVSPSMFVKQAFSLKFIKSFIIKSKNGKRKEFWFANTDNHLVNMTLVENNPLISLLEKQLNEPLNVHGLFKVKTRDGYNYFSVDNYKFI